MSLNMDSRPTTRNVPPEFPGFLGLVPPIYQLAFGQNKRSVNVRKVLAFCSWAAGAAEMVRLKFGMAEADMQICPNHSSLQRVIGVFLLW